MYSILFCLLVLMPFVSVGRLRFPSQIQPWAGVAAVIGLAVMFILGRVSINRLTLMLIAFGVFFIAYLSEYPPIHIDWMVHLKKSAVFLFSINVLLYSRYVTPRQLVLAVCVAAGLYASVAVLQFVKPAAYSKLTSFLVPDKNVFEGVGKRGATSLCPEATDFGFTAAYLLLFAMLCGAASSRIAEGQNRQLAWLGGGLAVVCIFLSTSGSGVIAGACIMALVLMSLFSTRQHLSWAILATLLIAISSTALLVVVPSAKLMEIRGVNLLYTTLTSPSELTRTSFAHRYVHNWVGMIGFWESKGLGYGAGTFTERAPEIYVRESIKTGANLTEYHVRAVEESLQTAALGIVPMLLLEYGVFGLAFVLLLVAIIVRSQIDFRLACLAMLLMSLLQSFPPAYPPLWMLLGLAQNPNFQAFPRSR